MIRNKPFWLTSAEAMLLALGKNPSMFSRSHAAITVMVVSMAATKLTAIHVQNWTRKPFGRSGNGSIGSGRTR